MGVPNKSVNCLLLAVETNVALSEADEFGGGFEEEF